MDAMDTIIVTENGNTQRSPVAPRRVAGLPEPRPTSRGQALCTTPGPTVSELEAAIENMSQGLCMVDAHQRIIVANSRYAELYGIPARCVRPGTTLREVIDQRLAAGSFPEMTRAEFLEWIEADVVSPIEKESVLKLRNGRIIAIRHRPLLGGGWVSTHDDITDRRVAEARVVYMARHDALTDLPNRVLLAERLERAIAQAGRGKKFAVFCLDLDGFKAVNDTFGHGVGDKLLIAVGHRLRTCMREVDTVARLGGDEFAILQDQFESPSEVTLTCERIIAEVGRVFEVEGCQISIGVSIGIAVAPEDGTACETLLRNADLALYLAKSEGRGTFRFFEPEMDATAQLRRALELDLRKAVDREELEVHYQPLVNLTARRVIGFEALLRWRHPVRGSIGPDVFVPLAEEIGLVLPMGDWVLRKACADAAAWPEPVKVAVNISPVQFRGGNLVRTVQLALAASGLEPSRLELEITETVLLKNNEQTLTTLKELRALGVRIALDDFGTGYSSLSYLQNFPFDKIKIDQSFVRGISERHDLGCIVRAVAGLGASLGMSTTAEGVETKEQLDRLIQEGCTEAQGFLFSAARPTADVRGMLTWINESLTETTSNLPPPATALRSSE